MNWREQLSSKKLLSLDTILLLLILITLGVSLQQYLLPEREFFNAMRPRYNNYLIFKYSFSHLINNLNLYTAYPAEYGDLYKYSPTFAVGMGFFYWLPDWLGVIVWNLVNLLCLFVGIKLLPKMTEKAKIVLFVFVISELIGSMQNLQSNALLTGFILLSFVFFERKNMMLAALFVVLAFYIKIFGIIAAALFILYPNKKKFLAYLGLWIFVLGILPLLFVSPGELATQYKNWFELLKSDHGQSYGFSVMGILHKWFGLDVQKWLMTVIGIVLFCLGYIRRDLFKDLTFRYLFLASILIWIVIFNHKAESPTFIIAMTGCGIWFFGQQSNRFSVVLLILAFVFTSLIQTDLFPKDLRLVFYAYYIKAVPSVIIWMVVIYQMLSGKYTPAFDLQRDTKE